MDFVSLAYGRRCGREGLVEAIADAGRWLAGNADQLVPRFPIAEDGFSLVLRMPPDGLAKVEVSSEVFMPVGGE